MTQQTVSELIATLSPKIRRNFGRSARLRCPGCGISPLYLPLSQVETITDWFTMLPGCPRCGYAYEREPGYYLSALWVIHFVAVAIFGVALLFLLDYFFPAASTAQLLFFTLMPVWGLGILFIRHVKAFFLAFDLLIDEG